MGDNKTTVLMAAYCGIFIVGLSLIVLGATLPQLSSLYNLNEIQMGLLATVLPFGILTGSLIFGPLADSFSYKYLLFSAVLLTALGMEIIAFSGEFHYLIIDNKVMRVKNIREGCKAFADAKNEIKNARCFSTRVLVCLCLVNEFEKKTIKCGLVEN